MVGSNVGSNAGLHELLRGQCVVQPGWLEPEAVAALRDDIRALDAAGQFVASGVATGGVDGDYSRDEDRLVSVLSHRTAADSRLDALCRELRRSLSRPTLSCAGERYYSVTRPGARLAFHMDERHEETKGERGWRLPTRRSVSWLLYLSHGDVRGGALRAYCRSSAAACGAHAGDLQVGWLDGERACDRDEPVFLDSWVRSRAPPGEAAREARSALYVLRRDGSRCYVSRRFGPADPSWSCEDDSPAAFAAALRAQCRRAAGRRFSGVEAAPHPRQSVVEVSPEAGTLVLMDAVAVPHEVLPTLAGERLALAGWLHEESQEPPEWFGEEA